MLVAVYGRVSGSRQEKQETIEMQFNLIAQWCLNSGHTIVGFYADTNCPNTVLLQERKDGARLLRDAALGRFQAIVFYELWRWSREHGVWNSARDRLATCGIQLFSVLDDLMSETSGDELGLDEKLAAGKYAGKMITLNCMNGKRTWASRNAYVGGVVPYGYDVDRQTEAASRHRGYLVVNDQPIEGVELIGQQATEAWVVKCVYRWFVEHRTSLRQIARRLNEAGVPVSSRSTGAAGRWHVIDTSGRWDQKQIGRLLRNPVYKGVRYYGTEKIPQRVPALVSAELWQAAQVALAEKGAPRGRNMLRYLLTGLIWCDHHNMRMAGQTPGWGAKNGYFYYVCPMKYRDGEGCSTAHVRGDRLEAELWELVCRRLKDNDGTVAKIREQNDRFEERQRRLIEQRDLLGAAIMWKDRHSNQTLRRMIEEDSEMSVARVHALHKDLEAGIESLNQQIAVVDAETQQLALTIVQLQRAAEWLVDYQEKLKQPFTREEKRQMLERFVKWVRVEVEGETTRMRYQLCYDPDLLPMGRSAQRPDGARSSR